MNYDYQQMHDIFNETLGGAHVVGDTLRNCFSQALMGVGMKGLDGGKGWGLEVKFTTATIVYETPAALERKIRQALTNLPPDMPVEIISAEPMRITRHLLPR